MLALYIFFSSSHTNLHLYSQKNGKKKAVLSTSITLQSFHKYVKPYDDGDDDDVTL